MDMIYLIFLIFLSGAVISWLAGKVNHVLQDIIFLASVIVPSVLFYMNVSVGQEVYFKAGGIDLSWGITAFGWIFSLIVLGLGVLAAIYSVGFMKGK